MKRILILSLCAMILSLSTAAWASLDGFLANLNVQAQADFTRFQGWHLGSIWRTTTAG